MPDPAASSPVPTALAPAVQAALRADVPSFAFGVLILGFALGRESCSATSASKPFSPSMPGSPRSRSRRLSSRLADWSGAATDHAPADDLTLVALKVEGAAMMSV